MKTFKKKFDFYATNVEVDEYVFGILKAETDPDLPLKITNRLSINNKNI